MTDPSFEPAPFACGDRVTFRPRPAGPETVVEIEWSSRGWPGWYIKTARPYGRYAHPAYRWAPAIELDRLDLGDIEPPIGGLPARGRCRRLVRALPPLSRGQARPAAWGRRILARLGQGALALLVLAVLWGVLLVLPS